MEFVGNQINFKTVLATDSGLLYWSDQSVRRDLSGHSGADYRHGGGIDSIHIFGAGHCGCDADLWGAVLNLYGDMMAMIFCGIFFLFFHNHRFTINQRTSVAVAAVIVFNCAYYAYGHLTYLLSIETMIKETIAVIVFIRVFNTIARILFVGKNPMQISEEKLD